MAGCTLDAGAKIYAGRVDAMYNDVYKMLGGLGRSNRTVQEGAEMSSLINTATLYNGQAPLHPICATYSQRRGKIITSVTY